MKTNRNQASANTAGTRHRGRNLFANLLWATRPMFLTASILPVVVGTCWGYRIAGDLDLIAFALALASIALLHAGANVLNDVYDELGGTDRCNNARIAPYTGGSRFIQNGVFSVRQMALWGSVLLLVGLALGVGLVALHGVVFMLFGLAGIALALLYSMPPVQLSARGLGELAVALGFGLLPVTGAAWLQTGFALFGALLISVPVACWVLAILLINEVPDREADQAAGKNTLVVRLGPGQTAHLYLAVQALACATLLLVVLLGMLAPWSLLLPLLLFAASVFAAAGINGDRARLRRSIEVTLAVHLLGCLWLAGWILAGV